MRGPVFRPFFHTRTARTTSQLARAFIFTRSLFYIITRPLHDCCFFAVAFCATTIIIVRYAKRIDFWFFDGLIFRNPSRDTLLFIIVITSCLSAGRPTTRKEDVYSSFRSAFIVDDRFTTKISRPHINMHNTDDGKRHDSTHYILNMRYNTIRTARSSPVVYDFIFVLNTS